MPPLWNENWVRRVPFVGGYVGVMSAFINHTTTLEENADFLAEDLKSGSLEWNLRRVGVKDKLT